ncbi:ribonuclease, Rne/Rng family [Lachnospiraceae bacterium G41]|nr:ribonuclease, Rne/Rng family [Lachnospiraceae bacterium G41]
MIKPTVKNEDAKKYVNSSGLELVIVRKDDNIVYLVFENKELIDIEFEKENELPVGTKCVGKVSKIAKDINSAFILLPDKSTAYLKNIPADLKCEQNIAVEITRASSKGKLPSVTLINEDIEHRTDLSIIEKGPKIYEKLLLKYKFNRILTDIDNILKEIKEFINSNNVIDLSELILYNDLMVSLSTLYSVSARLKEATSKVIWLKSGANIVIEETSAFTVIDVNSAKKDNKKSNSFLEINKEAAAEIFRQMNLRNLSGIILIDFINLEREEYKILMDELNNLAKTQKSFTKVVDITALGIAEITRKKEGITLSDIVK